MCSKDEMSFEDTKIVHATQKLITEVRCRPVLWNKSVKRSKEESANAWFEIAHAMNMREYVLKPKWKNLKDIFKREFIKAKKQGKEETKWRYYKHLKFLEVNLLTDKKKSTDSDKDKDSMSSLTTVFKLEPLDRQDCDEHMLMDPIASSGSDSNDQETNSPKILEEDEYDLLFLKSLLPFFHNLTPVRKLVVRTKMQEILLNEISRNKPSEHD